MMDAQNLKEELNKILELSSTKIDSEIETNKDDMEFARATSDVSSKARLNTETTLETATGNEIITGISFTALNLDKQVTVITDSQNKSFDSKVIEKPPTMTLNVAANEFIPAKDIQKTLANGQNAEDMIKEKSRLPSKIPRLTSNDTYFPRQGSELSIRELQEQNDNFPVELEQFPEERTAADVKLETIVSDDILPLLNNPQNQEDENKTDVFITKESNDICSTTGSFSSDPTMPLNESDISMEEYSKKVTDPSLHLIHTDPKVASTDVEVITTKQSGFSLKPQTSLTESNYDNQEVIVDDDGFERNFPKVPSGNLSRAESATWMDENSSFVTKESIGVVNLNHVKLSDGLRTFPTTSHNLDDNPSIEFVTVSQTDDKSQPVLTSKKSRKSFIKCVSRFFRKSTKN